MRKKIGKEKNSGNRRREEYFENVTVDFVGMDAEEFEKRICAVMRTLLEIDEILSPRESAPEPPAISEEAA